MIIGLGIDLVDIHKIAESVASETFRRKVFTPSEITICESVINATERYAGKFAAKEAFMKALGHGIRQEVWFTQIEVLNQDSGSPYLVIGGEAERVLRALGEKIHIHVSITHTRDTAAAVVILEK